jgi:hemerythrin
MPIVWDSALDTGIEVIDTQHKRIVTYVNQLEAAQVSGDRIQVAEIIEQLVDYTQSHFGFEEAMMEEAGYMFLKPHRKVHELFIKRVTDFTVRAAKGENIARELHSMLTKWLINHIANEDQDYRKAVTQMLAQQGAAAVAVEKGKTGFLSGLFGRFFH